MFFPYKFPFVSASLIEKATFPNWTASIPLSKHNWPNTCWSSSLVFLKNQILSFESNTFQKKVIQSYWRWIKSGNIFRTFEKWEQPWCACVCVHVCVCVWVCAFNRHQPWESRDWAWLRDSGLSTQRVIHNKLPIYTFIE